MRCTFLCLAYHSNLYLVLLVRDVITLDVVTRPRLLTPRTLDLTMPRVPRLVSAACFSSFNSLPMRTFRLLFPTSTFLLPTFDFAIRDS